MRIKINIFSISFWFTILWWIYFFLFKLIIWRIRIRFRFSFIFIVIFLSWFVCRFRAFIWVRFIWLIGLGRLCLLFCLLWCRFLYFLFVTLWFFFIWLIGLGRLCLLFCLLWCRFLYFLFVTLWFFFIWLIGLGRLCLLFCLLWCRFLYFLFVTLWFFFIWLIGLGRLCLLFCLLWCRFLYFLFVTLWFFFIWLIGLGRLCLLFVCFDQISLLSLCHSLIWLLGRLCLLFCLLWCRFLYFLFVTGFSSSEDWEALPSVLFALMQISLLSLCHSLVYLHLTHRIGNYSAFCFVCFDAFLYFLFVTLWCFFILSDWEDSAFCFVCFDADFSTFSLSLFGFSSSDSIGICLLFCLLWCRFLYFSLSLFGFSSSDSSDWEDSPSVLFALMQFLYFFLLVFLQLIGLGSAFCFVCFDADVTLWFFFIWLIIGKTHAFLYFLFVIFGFSSSDSSDWEDSAFCFVCFDADFSTFSLYSLVFLHLTHRIGKTLPSVLFALMQISLFLFVTLWFFFI